MPYFFIVFAIVIVIFFALVDPYLYRFIKKNFKNEWNRKIVKYFFFVTTVLTLMSFLRLIYEYVKGYSAFGLFTNWAATIIMATIVSKFVPLIAFLIIDLFSAVEKKVSKKESNSSRRNFIKKASLIGAFFPFSSFIYGTAFGRYNFKVFKQKLSFSDIPKSFDGIKIAQLTDIHSGSWDDYEPVKKGLELLINEKPDIIFLTGDLVNNVASEADRFIEDFAKLEAPLGKFAVMGNHDYGTHYNWSSEEEKQQNIVKVREQYKKMGFQLLENQSVPIRKEEEQIQLVGVENWGRLPFPQEGDLPKALEQVNKDDFKILLSHDPDHWEDHTLKHPYKVHLTLSGHTHGSQLGVEIPGFRWSPVKYRYKRWAGLYEEDEQFLYVNRGFGFIGYPGRVGIWPEIAILDLHKTKV